MTKYVHIDLNQDYGGAENETRKRIARHRAAHEAAHPRTRNAVKPETMHRLRESQAAAKRAAGTGDPTLDLMVEKGVPLTRKNYMDLAYPKGLPNPWTPWHEAKLPVIFRKLRPHPPKPVPKVNLTRHNIITYAKAIRILDESEIPMRDAIERDLTILRRGGEGKVKLWHVVARINQLMDKITAIRTAAFKKAFRYLRDNAK